MGLSQGQGSRIKYSKSGPYIAAKAATHLAGRTQLTFLTSVLDTHTPRTTNRPFKASDVCFGSNSTEPAEADVHLCPLGTPSGYLLGRRILCVAGPPRGHARAEAVVKRAGDRRHHAKHHRDDGKPQTRGERRIPVGAHEAAGHQKEQAEQPPRSPGARRHCRPRTRFAGTAKGRSAAHRRGARRERTASVKSPPAAHCREGRATSLPTRSLR